jgi:gas vesicle protein
LEEFMANYENDGGAGGILVAFIAGAVTGAALALMFAPASGEQTRGYIGARAREGRERAAEAARQGRERAAEAARQGREALNRQREQLATAFEKGREAFESARKKEQEG